MRPCFANDERLITEGVQYQPVPVREIDPLGLEFAAQLNTKPSDHSQFGIALDSGISRIQSWFGDQSRLLY